MEKTKLIKVVQDIRNLADDIEAMLDSANDPKNENLPKAEPAAKEEPKKPEVSLEKVRGSLAEKSRSGKTTEVRELIKKYGANKLSEIDPVHYADLLKDAEEL